MRLSWPWTVALFLSMAAMPACGSPNSLSIDSGECDPTTSPSNTQLKTSVFHDKTHSFSAYGELLIRRDVKAGSCVATYRLWVASDRHSFSLTKSFDFNLDVGQIAGIDLIGLSPDGTKFAADFLWAEGDGTVHHPAVYDKATGQSFDMSLDDRIQKLIHGCDQNEDFVGVTNYGEAVFAIPPSIYDDSPNCGDKGLWNFNLKTGKVHRVKRFSGVKWR